MLGVEFSLSADIWADISVGSLGAYDAMDQSVIASILEEHKLYMDGRYKKSKETKADQLEPAVVVCDRQVLWAFLERR